MKVQLAAYILSIAIALGGCKKDSDNSTGSSLNMEVGSDAVRWEADQGLVIGASYINGKSNLTIAGVDSDFNGESSGFSLVLSQTEEIGVGSYVIGPATDGGASISKIKGKTYLAGQGASAVALALEIIEVSGSGTSKKFRGRFQGRMQGSSITDVIGLTGTFSSF